MYLLFWSPVRFFETRLANGLPWSTAAAAPAMCAALESAGAWVNYAKMRPALEAVTAAIEPGFPMFPMTSMMVAGAALGYPMFFGVLFLAVLALDVLTSGSQQPRLLAKFTAVSLYTQAPYGIAMLGLALYWTPEPLHLAPGLSDTEIAQQLTRYTASIQSGPLVETGRLLRGYSVLWLSAVLAIALKVVGSLSVRATVAAAAVLFVICMAGTIFELVLLSLA